MAQSRLGAPAALLSERSAQRDYGLAQMGVTVAAPLFAHACKLGIEGILSKAKGFALPFGSLTALDQIHEPE